MKVEYDPEADAAYITLDDGDVVDTREIEDGINFDFDASGNVLGIEILSVQRRGARVKKEPVTVAVGVDG